MAGGENEMEEVFPILGGIVLGLFFNARRLTTWTFIAFVCLSACIAILASAISGELAVSWWYLGIDLIEVIVSGAVIITLLGALRRGRAKYTE
jgi:general stress protein CsbA